MRKRSNVVLAAAQVARIPTREPFIFLSPLQETDQSPRSYWCNIT